MVQIGDSVNLSLAGVNITGPKGTVIGPGTITVSRQRAEADMEGFTPASEGVEVALGGATLAHDLSLVIPGSDSNEPGQIPVLLHKTSGHGWTIEEATFSQGAFHGTAREFSLRIPGWLRPTSYVGGLLHQLVNEVVGRTDPPRCGGSPPSWATLNRATDYLHACLTSANNHARIELAANRKQWIQIVHPPDIALKRETEADTLMAQFIVNSLQLPTSVTVAGAGDILSFDISQPAAARTISLEPSISASTVSLSLIFSIIEVVSDASDSAGRRVTAALAFKACADKVPSTLKDARGLASLMLCVFTETMSQLQDPIFARRQAITLLEGQLSSMEAEAFAVKVSKVAKSLATFGKAMKAFALVQANLALWQSVVDAAEQAVAPNGNVEVDLRPKAPANPAGLPGVPSQFPGLVLRGGYECGPLPPVEPTIPLPVRVTSGTLTCDIALQVAQEYVRAYQSSRSAQIPSWECGANTDGSITPLALANHYCRQGENSLTIGNIRN